MSDEPRSPDLDLVAERQGLEALARRISGRRDEAEELVQEALLVALERPPDPGGDRGAWLRGVLRRLWRRRRQRAARRRTAELDPALPADGAPPEVEIERSETAAHFARLVLELDEPYREVLYLRFYEGRTPTEIGALLDRPVNTVTSQLARGLDRLRVKLEARRDERARRGRPWLLLGWRRRDADRARTTGSRAMLRAAHAAAVVALVASAPAFFLWRTSRPHDAAASTAVATAPPARPALRPASGVREPVDPSIDPRVAPALELELVGAAGEPVAGATVHVAGEAGAADPGGADAWGRILVGATDEKGRLRIPLEGRVRPWRPERAARGASGPAWTAAAKPGDADAREGDGTPEWSDLDFLALFLELGTPRESYHLVFLPAERGACAAVRIRVPELPVELRGRVRDADGDPVMAALTVLDVAPPGPEPDGTVRVEQGRTFVTPEPGVVEGFAIGAGLRSILVRAEGCLPHVDWVDGARGAVVERDFVLQPGSAVEGRVLDSSGNPARGARVTLEYRIDGVPHDDVAEATAGDDGNYRIDGVPAGPVLARAVHPDDPTGWDAAFLDLTETTAVVWSPELRARDPLRVRVLSDDGRAYGDCVVQVSRRDPADGWSVLARPDASGHATIDGLPAEPVLVEIHRSRADLVSGAPPCFAAGERVPGPEVHEIVVPRERLGVGTLTGRLRLRSDEPAPRALLYLRAAGAYRSRPIVEVERDGTFRRAGLGAQRYAALLVVDGRGALPLADVEIVAGETHDLGEIRPAPLALVEIDWRWTHAHAGFELVALAGVESGPASELPVLAGAAPPPALSLLPGRYRWTVTAAGRPLARRELEVSPGETLVLTTGP